MKGSFCTTVDFYNERGPMSSETEALAGFHHPPVVPPKMTFEQFLEWADEDTHAEWVNGEVIFLSPVDDRHQDLVVFLTSLLRFYAEERSGGTVISALFLMKTGPDLGGRQPDLIFVSPDHHHRLKEYYLDGPADLVVEIISPDSLARDRDEKFHEYQQGGVREYWLIDPLRKQAEFYLLGDDGIYKLAEIKQGEFHSTVLEGLYLEVDWLWQEPLPKLMDVLKAWRLVP